MITTVIFDMNGVIVNDEAIHEAAFREICRGLGVNLTSPVYQDICMGRTDKAGFEGIISTFGLKNLDVRQLILEKSQKYLELLPSTIESYPGVLELIRSLSKNFRLALASSSSRDEVERVVTVFRIKNFFEAIVTADDVSRGKPDPEPYLLAAQKLGENPAHCAVIEDSKNGVRSAKAAGMRCIAITTTHDKKDLSEADAVIDDFSALTENLIQGE